MSSLAFISDAPRNHLPDEWRIRRRRLHLQIMGQGGAAFRWSVGLHQAEPVPAPSLWRRIGILGRDSIALGGAGIVAGAIAQAPHLGLVIAKQAVPAVLRESLDQILAGA